MPCAMNVIILRGCAAIRQGQGSFEASERIFDDDDDSNYVSGSCTKKSDC